MIGNWLLWLSSAFVGALLALVVIGLLGMASFRKLVQWLLARFMKRLMSDFYAVNIWEMVTALTRTDPITTIENRSEERRVGKECRSRRWAEDIKEKEKVNGY